MYGPPVYRFYDNDPVHVKTMANESEKRKTIEEIFLIQRDCFELGHQFPDTGPGVDRHVGIIGDFINF